MQAFPCGLKLKCWRTSTPSPPGCPAPSSRFQPRMKSSSESGCVLSLETAECPEPLCPWRALPAHGATSRVASEDITPPSSLIRAHASDPVPPGASVVPRTPGPCRLSPVPAGGWPFPTLSLQSLRRRLDPYPAASLECTCPFLPREHRPHATEDAFDTRNCPFSTSSTGPFPSNHSRKTPKGPKIALGNPDRPEIVPAMQRQQGAVFRGCSHSFIFRLLRSLGPQIASTAASSCWAAGPFTPRIARVVTHSGMWHRYVSDLGN